MSALICICNLIIIMVSFVRENYETFCVSELLILRVAGVRQLVHRSSSIARWEKVVLL